MPDDKPQKNQKEQDKILKLLKALLEKIMKMFGMGMGMGSGGGQALDDNFFKNPANKEMFKDKAKEILNSKLGGFAANMALRFKSVRNMIDNHLKNNPELEKAAKEVLNENPALKEKFSNNKNFMKTFSRLVEPSDQLQKDGQKEVSAPQEEEPEPSANELRSELKNFGDQNPDCAGPINEVLNEHHLSRLEDTSAQKAKPMSRMGEEDAQETEQDEDRVRPE